MRCPAPAGHRRSGSVLLPHGLLEGALGCGSGPSLAGARSSRSAVAGVERIAAQTQTCVVRVFCGRPAFSLPAFPVPLGPLRFFLCREAVGWVVGKAILNVSLKRCGFTEPSCCLASAARASAGRSRPGQLCGRFLGSPGFPGKLPAGERLVSTRGTSC